jgi:hypothetical protein
MILHCDQIQQKIIKFWVVEIFHKFHMKNVESDKNFQDIFS